MAFTFKSFQTILTNMVTKLLATTGVTDINPGSVVTTLLSSAASEDAAQYFQAYQIIRNYNLDTVEGDDLDNRAKEFNLERLQPQKSTGTVTFGDSAFIQKKTKIFSGSRGPVSGQNYVDVDNASSFTSSGSIVVGRGTANAETVSYTSITNFVNYYRINLSGTLTNDHGTEESVILSQGGSRVISQGTLVRVPASDTTDEIQFITTTSATILDGDINVENIPIISTLTGANTKAPSGSIIEFDTLPFATATVSNPQSITNGTDLETDEELRNRIRLTIQSLSKGIKDALLNAVINLISDFDNKRIVSANLIDAVTLEDLAFLFIDDGTGLEPSFGSVGNEILIEESTGGEEFLQLNFFPVIKAEVKTENSQPFSILNSQSLTVKVKDIEETIIFGPTDYQIEGNLTAYEVATAINNKFTIIEARTADGGTSVVIKSKENTNETIQVIGGTANDSLIFSILPIDTISVYKTTDFAVSLLVKDGNTATIETGNAGLFNIFGGNTLTMIVDGKTVNPQTVTFQTSDFITPGAASPLEIVTRINKEISGATAFVSSEGNKISIKSNDENSALSKIHITGGSANTALNFSTVEIVGKNKDFTLNRFNGQIELETPAIVGEKYEIGTFLTRAFLTTANSQSFNLTNGDTITFKVDGGTNQVVTFNSADFGLISTATALEVAASINKQVLGVTASVINNKVKVTTNSYDSYGSIRVEAISGTAGNLGFTVGSTISNLQSHVGFTVSNTSGPYVFTEGMSLSIVVDQNPANKQFTILMDLDGIVTIGDASPTYTTFIANITSIAQNFNLKFTQNDDLKDFKVKWLTGANAATVSTVSVYTASSGQFTLSSGLTNPIGVGDTFTIIPSTTKNVVTYMSKDVVSSLPLSAEITLANQGTKVQIASLLSGSAGSVQITGGTANAILNFSTTSIQGEDGYKYYTGILQKAQHTIDGLDNDLENFPGVKAAGVQVEVLPPIVKLLTFEINISLEDGIFTSSIKDQIVDSVSSYINSLGVGKDVILSEVTDLLMNIEGVTDVEYVNPSSNVAVADNEIARISNNDIVFA